MYTKIDHLEDIRNIKKMMEQSSRFISLSGLSGIAAGICAIIGAIIAYPLTQFNSAISKVDDVYNDYNNRLVLKENLLGAPLVQIALLTFFAALLMAFFFTYLRSKKTKTPLWGHSARRLMIQVAIPMIAGGILILALINQKDYKLIAPCCLIFYGLALINASKNTITEIKYLGYCELIIGLISLWLPGNGLFFWVLGFGVLHILYGTIMWYKYER
ncbi:MAG: hypothetical protein WCO37_12530 [Bacteroidota bacterium]|jgi:hypothetical protein